MSAEGIESALNQYKTGDRKHPTMRGIADALSDQDIKDIAGYYSKLGLEGVVSKRKDSALKLSQALSSMSARTLP